jgi:hypothetical protein
MISMEDRGKDKGKRLYRIGGSTCPYTLPGKTFCPPKQQSTGISHIILSLSANHQFPSQGFCPQFFIFLLATAAIQQPVRPSVGHAV